MNGKEQAQQVQLIRTAIPIGPGRTKIIWTAANGMFVGEMDVMSMNQDALKAMCNDFAGFVTEQTSGLLLATGAPANHAAKPS